MSFGISGLSGGSHSYASSGNPFGQFLNGVAQAVQSYEDAHKTASAPASTPTELPPAETVTPAETAAPIEQAVTPQPVLEADTSTASVAATPDDSLHSLIAQAESASTTSGGSGITSTTSTSTGMTDAVGPTSSATTSGTASASRPTAAETVLRSKAEIMAQAAYSMVAQADNRNNTQALLKHA